MKKYFLLILGVIAIGMMASIDSISAPRGKIFVDKVYTNNGNTRVPFSVAVDSTSWVQVLPTRANRRYAILQTTSSSLSGYICLSTTTQSSIVCDDTTNGMIIGNPHSILENYSEAVLYARYQDGVAGTVYIKGEEEYDNGD